MIKTTEDLKAFILWAKENDVQRIKLKGVEVEFNQMSAQAKIYKDLLANESNANKPVTDQKAVTLADTDPNGKQDDEETLFWSAGR